MPTASGVIFLNDFTGGLNLTAQAQNIQPNESPNCLNVDFGDRGGITLRSGWRRQVTDADLDGGKILTEFSGGTSNEYLYMIDNDGALNYTDGSVDNLSVSGNILTDAVLTTPPRAVVYGSAMYVANCRAAGVPVVRKITSPATMATPGTTANNNYAAPSGSNMPLCRVIANHMGYMWFADTFESATRYRSRVRYSHFLQPENFADADYFDIASDDDDEITALVPFHASLLVFKRKSVWAIYGTSREDFVPERLSGVSGTPSQEAVTYNAGVCYWWSSDGNVFSYNGQGIIPLGERIRGVVMHGGADPANANAQLCWSNGRLYLSLEGVEDYLLVYDPSVGQEGAWTRYDFPFTSAHWWRPATGDPLMYFLRDGEGKLYSYGDHDLELDADTADTQIMGHYYTGWQDAGETATLKRWMRPRITTGARAACTLTIDTYTDFNLFSASRELQVMEMDDSIGGGVWGDDWGFLWGGTGTTIIEFERLQRLGRGHAVALAFRVLNPNGQWWIDSIAIPYKKKTIR